MLKTLLRLRTGREVFGEDALNMLAGKIALRLEGNEVVAEAI